MYHLCKVWKCYRNIVLIAGRLLLELFFVYWKLEEPLHFRCLLCILIIALAYGIQTSFDKLFSCLSSVGYAFLSWQRKLYPLTIICSLSCRFLKNIDWCQTLSTWLYILLIGSSLSITLKNKNCSCWELPAC